MNNEMKVDLKFALNEIQKNNKKEEEIANVFVEMLKDEINSESEMEIFNNVKALINKYHYDDKILGIIDEVIEAISGGATMTEVLLVAKDEVLEPTIDDKINLEKIINQGNNDSNFIN